MNLTKQQQENLFTSRLKDIQGELEDYFTDYEGNKEFMVVCRYITNFYASEEEGGINCVGFIFIDEDNRCIDFRTKHIEDFTTIYMEDIIKQLISNVYDKEINWRNSVIRNWKAFSSMKVKSLSTWMARGNTKKVNKINEELVNRYKLVESYKNDVNYYKMFVSSLYFVKDNLVS